MGAQTELHAESRGRVMAMDSAYDVVLANRGRDVVVNASYCGVLPARFIAEQRPRGAIGVDCGVGPAGASIAGLWYLEALQIPAAVADVMTVKLGDGVDLHTHGVVSHANQPALDCGVRAGMPVREAALRMLAAEPYAAPAAATVALSGQWYRRRRVRRGAPTRRRLRPADSESPDRSDGARANRNSLH